MIVRPMAAADASQMLALMKALALFENYAAEFAVTQADLIERGLGPMPQFHALVADDGAGRLIGMAVTYAVPFTFTLKPTLHLKELYVADGWRGRGIGRALLRAVARLAHEIGADRLRWSVLAGNEDAARFYRAQGALPDGKWEPWQLDAQSLFDLVV